MKDHPITIKNRERPETAPIRARWCESFSSRLHGFTWRKEIKVDEGLLLVEARDSRIDTAIHMMFVWTDLAVAWVNSEMEVVDTALAKAWHPFYAPRSPARFVFEFHPSRHGEFHLGDHLEIIHEE
jgi:uncharacterized membrane protein (UPF0127 family)